MHGGCMGVRGGCGGVWGVCCVEAGRGRSGRARGGSRGTAGVLGGLVCRGEWGRCGGGAGVVGSGVGEGAEPVPVWLVCAGRGARDGTGLMG